MTGKTSILIPSPNVAEDHQTINARALADRQAAVLLKDSEAVEKLADVTLELLENEQWRKELAENIHALAKPDAAKTIAKEVIKLVA